MRKDNLFDAKFTFLDAVKIALLIVTAFSTWNVVDIMTPDTSMSFIRKLAALFVVEGAFIGFEMATADAKSRRQTKFATWGFFCSLVVIGLFAGVSGLLEFGGMELLAQSAGSWLGLAWTVKNVIEVSALVVLVVWIVVLASLYRLYVLNDPEKKAELDLIEMDEDVTEESNKATRSALKDAQPLIAAARARAHVDKKYAPEIGVSEMVSLLERVDSGLREKYNLSPADKTVAVDPNQGFVLRTPPMEKTVEPSAELHYHPMSAPVVREPLPKLFRGEPIYFKSALETGAGAVKISKGDELQAVLCEDGKYNLSEPNETYAFARVSAEELDYWRTGMEVKPASSSFRPQ